jgi:hypothetical protein
MLTGIGQRFGAVELGGYLRLLVVVVQLLFLEQKKQRVLVGHRCET